MPHIHWHQLLAQENGIEECKVGLALLLLQTNTWKESALCDDDPPLFGLHFGHSLSENQALLRNVIE